MKSGFGVRLKRFAYIVAGLAVAGLAIYLTANVFPVEMVVVTGIVSIVLFAMLIRPPALVMRSRLFVLALLTVTFIGAFEATSILNAKDDKRLGDLKMVNPNAYVDELKALGRDKEWFAALKEIRPNEYRIELAQRTEETKLDLIRKEEEAGQERLDRFFDDAKGDGKYGLTARKSDFAGIWNLSVPEGLLHCKQGPIYNGRPRPLVLFDAGGVTYGVNGAAMGKAGYPDARTLLAGVAGRVPYDLQMIRPLLEAGLLMCQATLYEECGEKIEAITWAQLFVKKRLKSPSSADFSLLDTRYSMAECGVWSITSYVDAKNNFNATTRTHYTVSVAKLSKDKWKLLDLRIRQ